MNRTKIEWTDFTWNPITGCKHGCWYCYAKKLTVRFKKIFPNGFEPTFYSSRLKEPWEYKKHSKIFVCSIADLFATWTPIEWRMRVMDSMLWCPIKHQFQMLTKNPENIPKADQFEYPDNFWFGTTVTGENGDEKNIDEIKKVDAGVKFVSFEPLLGSIDLENHSLEGIDWVIIGKLTGSKRVKLNFEWLADIVDQTADLQIPLFMKNNLGYERLTQQFPKQKFG